MPRAGPPRSSLELTDGLCGFPGVCAVNGLLYVVGGDDGSCNLASVEYYNPGTDRWTLLPTNMSTGRSYAGQCVLSLARPGPPTPWRLWACFVGGRALGP